jgi:GntR family transcriptional regulator/MocR family aminotransferase
VPATVQEALAEFIADGHFGAHIRRMSRLYHTRRDHMVEGLKLLAGGASLRVTVPAGGMQMMMELDGSIDDVELASAAGTLGLTARPLSRHYLAQQPKRGLYLGFAAWDEREITAGLALLRKAVRKVAGPAR